MVKILFSLASLFGGLGVVLGAFGAHYLKQSLSLEAQAVFETGVRYQMYHAFALFIAALALAEYGGGLFLYGGWAFVIGTLLFSGSLYLIAVYGLRALGIITPIGGLFFVAGWTLLLIGFLKTQVF